MPLRFRQVDRESKSSQRDYRRTEELVQRSGGSKTKGGNSPFENGVSHSHLGSLSFLRFDRDHEARARIQLALDRFVELGGSVGDLLFVDDGASERGEHCEGFGRADHHSRPTGCVVAEDSSHRVELERVE